MSLKLKEAQQIAIAKGLITQANQLQKSTRINKRFMIYHNNKWIHFGAWPFNGKGTYLDHKSDMIRNAWRARHEKILLNGKPAYLNNNSPSYYSYSILW